MLHDVCFSCTRFIYFNLFYVFCMDIEVLYRFLYVCLTLFHVFVRPVVIPDISRDVLDGARRCSTVARRLLAACSTVLDGARRLLDACSTRARRCSTVLDGCSTMALLSDRACLHFVRFCLRRCDFVSFCEILCEFVRCGVILCNFV